MRNMFTTSVLLISIYLGLSIYAQRVEEKKEAYRTIVDILSEENKEAKEVLKSRLNYESKKSTHFQNLKDSLYRRIKILEEIKDYPEIAKTWRGKTLLENFNFSIKFAGLSEDAKYMQNYKIDQAILGGLTTLLETWENYIIYDDEIQLLIDDKKRYYTAGKSYDLEFLLFKTLSTGADRDLKITTHMGNNDIEWDTQPFVTDELKNVISISSKITDHVTGEKKKYIHKITP